MNAAFARRRRDTFGRGGKHPLWRDPLTLLLLLAALGFVAGFVVT